MNVDKIISELEGKETLLIFLRDNYPDVLEKFRLAQGQRQAADANGTNSDILANTGDDDIT
jgi:hypothetical protein